MPSCTTVDFKLPPACDICWSAFALLRLHLQLAARREQSKVLTPGVRATMQVLRPLAVLVWTCFRSRETTPDRQQSCFALAFSLQNIIQVYIMYAVDTVKLNVLSCRL
mmetsp:Transcript_14796/g.24504  ORF Transcript_14796/g.24504 Transcript_14796/m.24504 type:complete len:108 (-) Transcript_14796:73-396(-)